MPPSNLEALPTETIQQICEYLEVPGISNLSYSSRRCRIACRGLRFRTIHLNVCRLESLQLDIVRLSEVLKNSAAFRHVRRLEIGGHEVPGRLSRFKYWPDSAPPAVAKAHEADWKPLVELLARLTGLLDFVYGSPMQLSPYVLDALEECLPNCKLHVDTFHLRSLLLKPGEPIRVDPYERRLATCPQLKTLALRFDWCESSGDHNFNLDAVMSMVAGVAPSLKEVSILREAAGSSPGLLQAARAARSQWKGNELGDKSEPKGGLTLLELAGSQTITLQSLQTWSKLTDFASLLSLKLHNCITDDILTYLATEVQFSSLHTLLVEPWTPREDQVYALQEKITSFIRSIPPLRNLTLTGDIHSDQLEHILSTHGSTLRRLHLPLGFNDDMRTQIPLTKQDIKNIQLRCPELEDLSILMSRSAGNADEVETYQILGKIPKLKILHLNLDGFGRDDLEDVDFAALSEFDKSPFRWPMATTSPSPSSGPDGTRGDYNYEVRTCLINHAIDMPLAASIFRTISSARPRSASGSPRLESLSLSFPSIHNSLAASGFPASLWTPLEWLVRAWRCTAILRDDVWHECEVVEVEAEERMERDEMNEDLDIEQEICEVVQRIWPSEDVGDWRRNWHGFPLNSKK